MRATEFVDSYMDAWNHRDPEGVASHLANNGRYFDIPDNVQHAPADLVAALHEFFSEFRHRYELVGKPLANRDTVAFQYRMVPHDDGKKSGIQTTYHGAEFVTLRDDAATMISDYYDVPGEMHPSVVPQSTAPKTMRRKYAKSGLDDELLHDYKTRLEDTMRSRQIFLEPDLTLPKLAKAIDCSVNHLSQVINSGFGVSFFDYLNRYRIRYSQELLSSSDGQDHAVLNIAYAVGFNSNSAFYAAFKKYVGQTPAHYRKERLSPGR